MYTKLIVDSLCQKDIEYLKDATSLAIEHCESLITECKNLNIKDTFILEKKRLKLIRIRAKLKVALDKAKGIIPIKKKE